MPLRTPGEVLAHLRACAEVWGGCARRRLAEDVPTITSVNPRTLQATADWVTDLELRRMVRDGELVDAATPAA